jgi:hypothetical protein
MAERDTKLLQVLISQMTQDGCVDVVVSEAPSVLRQPKRFEPLRNLLHCGHPATGSYVDKDIRRTLRRELAVRPPVRPPSDCLLVGRLAACSDYVSLSAVLRS